MDDLVGASATPRGDDPRRVAMLEPDEVGAMLRLHRFGWGTNRIAAELGYSRTTVKRYIEAGGWTGYLPFDPNVAHLFFKLISRRSAPCW